MLKHLFRILSVISIISLIIFQSACAKKTKPDAPAEGSSAVTSSDIQNETADSDSGKAMGLKTVYFPYDSAILDAKSKQALSENLDILKNNGGIKIQVEGHCDERGGIQYNIALGERRASSVKSYLSDHGISADRVSTISYGKEKPIEMGHDETSYAKNRRANFRITEK